MAVRVLVVAPSRRRRAAIEAMIASSPGLVVLPAATPDLDADVLGIGRPDVLLVDGDEAQRIVDRELAAISPPPGLVLLADEPAPRSLAGSRLGVGRGILPRDANAAELAGAISAVAAGLAVVHPAVSAAAAGRRDRRATVSHGGATLTTRETEILGMLAEGLANKDIARRLGISRYTVKFHLASIFAKLGATSRTEAVTVGLRRGLVTI